MSRQERPRIDRTRAKDRCTIRPMSVAVVRLTLWRLEIPLRTRFQHAASAREVAEPLIVQAELSNGAIGFGETHPRAYVSGETLDSAVTIIRDFLPAHLVEIRAENFPEALEAIDALPSADAQD